MKKNIFPLFLLGMVFTLGAVLEAKGSWFSFGKKATDPEYNNKDYQQFIAVYKEETKNDKQQKYYQDIFDSAYKILLDNYVYTLSNKKLHDLLTSAEEAVAVKKQAALKNKKTLTAKDINYVALATLYNGLDPHTTWLSPGDTAMLKKSISGEYEGVGIVLGLDKTKKHVIVVSVIEDGPADKAGVKGGDLILSINGKEFTGKQLDVVANFLRGKKETTVTLKVKRDNKIITFNFKRQRVDLKTVYAENINKYAYIDINTFNFNTTTELKAAFKKLDINKDKGIILDLRNNPGGLLYSSLIVSNMFVNNGTLLEVKGRDSKSNMSYHAANNAVVPANIPVVILVNNMTASAAEIVSAALSQNGRAAVMGQTSFGKGSVQAIFDLKDGSSAKITIQLFYTPSGEALQGIGVTPDIVITPITKTPFYNIRETSYKNYLIIPHKHLAGKKSIAINAKICKPYTKLHDREIGCAVEYLDGIFNTALAKHDIKLPYNN